MGLGVQPLVLQRDRRGGADGLDELGVVVQRRVVDERGERAAVALDLAIERSAATGGTRPGRRRRRRSPATRTGGDDEAGSPSVLASAFCSSTPRVVRRSWKRSARPPRARRERSSPARNAAGHDERAS